MNCFHSFKTDIHSINLPLKFTFPFYFEPHPLTKIAAQEVQQYLENQTDWDHNFGLNENHKGLVIGKMFGVLVVENSVKEIGYLAAFSGKLADQNHISYFVPPVFDMLDDRGFYKIGEAELKIYNRKIEASENESELLKLKIELENINKKAEEDIATEKENIKCGKQHRANIRATSKLTLTESEHQQLLQELAYQSLKEGINLKQMIQHYQHLKNDIENRIKPYLEKINELKTERKHKSAALQQKLFEQYHFINQFGDKKSIGEIFDGNPPAGAGECAAPKLLQYAFLNQLRPITFAEFWWGQSPKSEIRKHRQYYPACKGKCEPILNFMLEGIEMDENPLKINPAEGKSIEIIYEDDFLAVVQKPDEFLSVPGKEIKDSVYSRIKNRYPDATGPLVVHRLDMSTSGLLLIAKTQAVYVALQAQFIKRTVKKRYQALLDGNILESEGMIDLPLRLDIDNRPHQVVCFEFGKPAKTIWKVRSRINNQTLVDFYPVTGRTHQLRVHAAHPDGLNCPIVGDDLYGNKANRLHLHAAEITFYHPKLQREMTFVNEIEFMK